MKNNYHYPMVLLGSFVLFSVAMGLRPLFRDVWLVENILLWVFLPALVLSGQRFKFSNFSYTLIFLLCVLQTIGAHYTYALVPMEGISEWFGFQRNHYDRLVHFSFGLLLAYPVRELFVWLDKPNHLWAFCAPIIIVFAASSVYEILEWMATMTILKPKTEDATLFLGAQGDIWDAQKDMALVGAGAIVAMLMTTLFGARWNRTPVADK